MFHTGDKYNLATLCLQCVDFVGFTMGDVLVGCHWVPVSAAANGGPLQ